MLNIENMADGAEERNYIVARFNNGEWWYWGAWDDMDAAVRTADEIDGAVFDTYVQKVWNVPDDAQNASFVVARYSNGEWWYWGAWDDEQKALQAAAEIGGYAFPNLRR